MPDAAPLLTVSGLCAGYGRIPVLRAVDLSLSPGERVGILGHNGAGKTTLLRTLIGELPATAGTIGFSGFDITGWTTTRRARAGIGYVPQGRGIFTSLSVRENLRMGCLTNPANEAEVMEESLAFFPRLKAYLDRPGGALSGGEQQLLALARCLCASPKLILLDEPTEGIQPSIREEVADVLAAVSRTRGIAIFLVEQNLPFLTATTKRIIHIRRGTVGGSLRAG